MKESLLIIFCIVSLFVAPIMLIDFIDNLFWDKATLVWWFKQPGITFDKVWTITEVVFPALVAVHWIIIAIWFPHLYK